VLVHDARNLAARDQRGADPDVRAAANQQDFVEFDGGAEFGRQFLDAHHVAFGDAILLAARRNDRVHEPYSNLDVGGRGAPAERRGILGDRPA